MLALFVSPAPCAIPPAGAVISGRSSASFEVNGSRYSVLSNEVSSGVLAMRELTVLPNGTAQAPAAVALAFGGETVTFPFILRNAGNVDDEYSFAVVYPAPCDFVPAETRLYVDEDGDGIIDPGERVAAGGGPLRPGDEMQLVLRATLPIGLAGGETAHIGLIACSSGDTAVCDRDNVARIVARSVAEVPLALEADRSAALPGDTIRYTLRFSNTGERAATAVSITDYIDHSGVCVGVDYVAGSASSPAGRIEFLDTTCACWLDVAPPPARVAGVRLRLDRLEPGAQGLLSFAVRVEGDREPGDIRNTGRSSFTDLSGPPQELLSNEVSVRVGRVSAVAIGPRGNPAAETGSPADRVIATLGADSSVTLWHEVANQGNFADSFRVSLADSALIPSGWSTVFVDSTGVALLPESSRSAVLGSIARGRSAVVGLRLGSTREGLRRFPGRELGFDVEAASLIVEGARDRVEDVLVKADIPLVSITQSIREPTALVGDVLSFIVAVENVSDETLLDSVSVTENLSPGLGFATGSMEPAREGNRLRWSVGRLEPGEKREIVFRARVKAGQEAGRLVSSAFAYGSTDMGERVSDGPSVASVLIVEGVFTRRGIIFGGVFVDDDGDGLRGENERGVRGVSVFVENATYAVTDSAGLYSIPGIVEGRHVVRIDPSSLPDSLVSGRAAYFGLGSEGLSLVDLPPSGMRRVDFPVVRGTGARRRGARAGSAAAGALGAAGSSARPPAGEGAIAGSSNALAGRDASEGSSSTLAGHAAPGASSKAAPAGYDDAAASSKEAPAGYDAITIPSTRFAPGAAAIEGLPLDKIAALSLWMREHPGWKIVVEGHSDSIPMRSAEYPSNLELSLARARSVFQILRMNAIPEERMDYTGYGSRAPVASNATEEGRAANRRVEIRVIPPEGYSAGDPGLPIALQAASDSANAAAFSLADSTGICADIVKPDEGSIFFSRGEIDVELVSPLGSETELYVNNVPVGRERIGLKRIDILRGTYGSVFYGVKLEEGKNDILVVCREYGGKRFVCVRHVYLAGRPARITPERELARADADGRSAPEVVFLVSDEHGLPVRDGVFVTVDGPRDLLAGLDANPHQTGVQAPTEGGRVTLRLPPSREARRERIGVRLDDMSAECRVSYDSPLRDWFLFGYGEGAAGYGGVSGSGSTLRSLEGIHDGAYAEGKIALYGQGEIGRATLLTCAVDTRPVRDDMLFRRVEPEKYYPIYGDASELKFNAASRSGTYLRLENRLAFAMLGDFKTDLGKTEFTRYHRSFNGVTGEARFSRGSATAFVTRTDQATYQEEIPAQGTSGFYFLAHYPVVEGSEKIRVEVRDRYRPETIVRVDYKQVNRDYDINYMDGSILFKESVPVLDESLNPVTIVVSYECRGSGDRNFIYGMRASAAVKDSLELGATAVVEEEGAENSTLLGIDLAGALRKGLRVEGELAHSEKFLLGGGNAFRLALEGEDAGALRWSAYYRNVDAGFFNPSFSGGKTELGATKYGGDLDWRLNKRFGVSAAGYRHELQERDETRDYVSLLGTYATGTYDGSLGFAGAGHSDTRDGGERSLLLLASIGRKGGATQGEIQWDQVVAGGDVPEHPNRLQAKLSRKLWKNVTAALKHEYRSGAASGTRPLTSLGVESSITSSMTAYSRYQLEGASSGERAQAAMGIENRFAISDDFTATAGLERLATVSGAKADDYLAISTGALYTPRDGGYRAKGDYEIRFEPDRRRHLLGLAALRKLDERWSFLLKGDLWFSDEKREADHVKGSSTLGVAMRPKRTGSLDLFALVKSVYEKNSPAHPGAVDREILSSVEASYRLGARWELEGKCAARWVQNVFRDYEASSSAVLYQGQIIRTIGRSWDVALAGRVVNQRETTTYSYGGGVELGRIVSKGVRAGIGYDFSGHEDADAAANAFTSRGFHVGLRLAFDEKIMSCFSGAGEEGAR